MEPELGDSTGERRRIDIGNGVSVRASLNRWASGFSRAEGIECESEGVRAVGGSYLHWLAVFRGHRKYDKCCLGSPNTHHKHLKVPDWYRNTLEYLRESEQRPAIAGGAFREHNKWSIGT